MRWIACAALLVVGNAQAQTLYKCVSGQGTSYQQAACPASARTVRTIETTPELPPTAADLAARQKKALDDRAESDFLSHLAGTDRLSAPSRRTGYSGRRADNSRRGETACEAAKTARGRALDRIGLDRTFDLLRRLDEEVAAACTSRR